MEHLDFVVWLLGSGLVSVLSAYVSHVIRVDRESTQYQLAQAISLAFTLYVAWLLY